MQHPTSRVSSRAYTNHIARPTSTSLSFSPSLSFFFLARSFFFLKCTTTPARSFVPAAFSSALHPNRRPIRSSICRTLVLKWFLWSCDQPSSAGTRVSRCGDTTDVGRDMTATLAKPSADLTISRLAEEMKTMRVEIISESMVGEIVAKRTICSEIIG